MASWTLIPRGAIAILEFDRPPRQTMTLEAMTELVDHLERLAKRSDEFTVVLLTGGDSGYFVAHADLDDLAVLGRGELPPGDPAAWTKALHLLETMPQPTVAAIDGQAWGGGCEIALACTLRIGSERAHLGQPEVSVGIIPGAGGTQRLPRVVGPAKAAELCLSGRIIQADEAVEIGLLNAAFPTEGFRDAAVEWCQAIARHPGPAVFACKQAIHEGLELPLAEGLKVEGRLFVQANASDDAKRRNAETARGD